MPELVHNIHVALQTQAMLGTLRTTSNYVIATWIIVVATWAMVVATFLGVGVALFAALK